jgi:hypothetical protein
MVDTGSDSEAVRLPDGRVLRADQIRLYARRAGLDVDGAIAWFGEGIGPYDAERAIDSGRTLAEEAELRRRAEEERRREEAERRRQVEAEREERRRREEELGPFAAIVANADERDALISEAVRADSTQGLDRLNTHTRALAGWHRHGLSFQSLRELVAPLVTRQVDEDTVDEWLRLGFTTHDLRTALEEGEDDDSSEPDASADPLTSPEAGQDEALLLNLTAMADLLGVKAVTMRMWRRTYDGVEKAPAFPAPRQVHGRSPLFSVNDVTKWMDDGQVREGRRLHRLGNRAVTHAPGRQMARLLLACQHVEGFEATRRFAAGVLMASQLTAASGSAPRTVTDLKAALAADDSADENEQVTVAASLLGDTAPSPEAERLAGWLIDPPEWTGSRSSSSGAQTRSRGRLVDEVLDRSAGEGRAANPYSTPVGIAGLMANVADLTHGERVVDAACGEGAILAACGRRADGVVLEGWELDAAARELAVARLACWSLSTATLHQADFLTADVSTIQPDVVVSDVPTEQLDEWIEKIQQFGTRTRAVLLLPEWSVRPGANTLAIPADVVEAVIILPFARRSGRQQERQVVVSLRHAPDVDETVVMELPPAGFEATDWVSSAAIREAQQILNDWRGGVRPEESQPREPDATPPTKRRRQKSPARVSAWTVRKGLPLEPELDLAGISDVALMQYAASADDLVLDIPLDGPTRALRLAHELTGLIEANSAVRSIATAETIRALGRFAKNLEKTTQSSDDQEVDG